MERDNHERTIAFAKQSVADLKTFDMMQRGDEYPECHQLLFLQLGCEKLAKAHLFRGANDSAALQGNHGYTRKSIPIIVRMYLARFRVKSPGWMMRHTQQLCGEIEVLSPQIDRDGKRPDNCEYPWEDGTGNLQTPIEWRFQSLNPLLLTPASRAFLKIIRTAASELADSNRGTSS